MDTQFSPSEVFSKKSKVESCLYGELSVISMEKIYDLLLLMQQFKMQSNLGLSLARSLRHFDVADVFAEVNVIRSLLGVQIQSIEFKKYPTCDYRIKSVNSTNSKFLRNKNKPSATIKSVFNDLIGFRVFVDSYGLGAPDFAGFRIVDMRNGKQTDDGYRGVHIYHSQDNFHYPVELQVFTQKDFKFNEWLHSYVYKYSVSEVGKLLRTLYEQGVITDEDSFRRCLDDAISSR